MPDSPTGGVYGGLLLSRRVVRYASQLGLVLIAAVLLLVAAYRLTELWLVPEITIAVPNTQPGYGKLFDDLARIADANVITIKTLPVADSAAVAKALEQRRAGFGVIRPDEAMPTDGLTAAILREDPLVVLSWEATKITRLEQLAKKRLGLMPVQPTDGRLLRRVLSFHDVGDTAIVGIGSRTDDFLAAIAAKQIDAIAVIGPPSEIRRVVRALADLKPVIVSFDATALLLQAPELSDASLAAKSLTGELPAEEVQTISASYRLIARKDVERASVSALLQALFAHRLALAKDNDLAWQIKGLGDEGTTYAKVPSHRGAVDYYNREQQTIMDLYGDFLWLGLFAAGGLSSAGAWVAQMLSRRRKQLVESILDRLLEILSEARVAETVAKLDELTTEVDGLVTHAVRQARWRATDPVSTTALTLAIDSSRTAIADRRAMLQREKKPPALIH